MKLKILLLLLAITTSSIAIQAQTSNTLEEQFTDVIEKSNRYQDYKVVKIFKLNNLRKNVNDSLAESKQKLDTANATITSQKEDINTLTANLTNTQKELSLSKEKENGIEMFGAITEKSTYKTIMWSIIGLLILALVFFIYKFKSSHSVTKAAQLKLAETEIEFEEHRQKKLEELQVLRRKLQDEINKNK